MDGWLWKRVQKFQDYLKILNKWQNKIKADLEQSFAFVTLFAVPKSL